MARSTELIEYRVKDVSRYIVTRYHGGPDGASIEERGEYGNKNVAHEVAYALCKAEHERLGWDVGDPRIQYPKADISETHEA